MTNKLWVLLFISALAAGAVACGAGDQATATTMKNLDTSSFISITEAISFATNKVEGGYPIGAKLSVEPAGGPEPTHYEVLLFVDGKNDIMEASVNVDTGEVFEVEVADNGTEDNNTGE